MNKRINIYIGLFAITIILLFSISFYYKEQNATKDEPILLNKILKERLEEKDSISIEQFKNLGTKLNSDEIIFDSDDIKYSLDALTNKFILLIPYDACSSCVTQALEPFTKEKKNNETVAILCEFNTKRELSVFEQQLKAKIPVFRISPDFKNYFTFSYKFPALFSLDKDFNVNIFFYCQSFELTKSFYETIIGV